ncbi:RsmD family RNA methyltransferase [Deinococcus sp.]|uniref:RsmD family RNA methyltransferase n=1 Tax=Deinococcus sp. TaxID=47478 RepID=UPI002869C473|nr:RsmD family RNA methyltransferase [Deinococcus sp.]
MSVRILGGTAKGREIHVPESARPSGARIRKSLFDLLAARAPAGRFPAFLDMHGGSGAIGLEAASRGHDVTLVETDLRALKMLETNARALDLRVRIVKGDSGSLLPRLGTFDVVFSDPPYEADIPALARQVLNSPSLGATGLLICQHPDRLHLPDHVGFEREERRYGSNSLTVYTRSVPDDDAPGDDAPQDAGRDTIPGT